MLHVLCCWLRETDECEVGASFYSDLFKRVQVPHGLVVCIRFYSLQSYWIKITSLGIVEYSHTNISTLGEFLLAARMDDARYSLVIGGERDCRSKDIQRACKEALVDLDWLYIHQATSARVSRSYSLRHFVVYYLAHVSEAPGEVPSLYDLVRTFHPDPLVWIRLIAHYIYTSSGTSVTLLYPPASAMFEQLTSQGDKFHWEAVRPTYWGKDHGTGVLLPTPR